LTDELLELVAPYTGGDPMGSTKYVRRSLRHLSAELAALGHEACPTTVANLLREQDYAPHVNVKRCTGPPHPDRDTQFRYLQEWVEFCADVGLPILSVDTKKKELIGNFANAGAAWSLAGEPVNAHDFRQDARCRAVPYGIYDLLANRGHVTVGTSADTPAFAVDAIAGWWGRSGRCRYPEAPMVLLLADAGGSNSCRARLWKLRLQERLADRYGLAVTVCHYPTGASKWNPVEHRLFGPLSTNWAGTPLRTLETLLGLIRGTQTRTGLSITGRLLPRPYQKGIKVSRRQMDGLDMEYHATCPQWNYTIWPRQLELLN
jgi:hypothetical protein